MFRLVVLALLLLGAAWLARESGWSSFTYSPIPSASPHDAYRRQLMRSGLDATPLGRSWLDAADHVLAAPTLVPLPESQRVRISAEAPMAVALRVELKRGQRLDVDAQVIGATPAHAFIDVYEHRSPTRNSDHQDGALRALTHEAPDDGQLIVRVQPELLRSGRLEIALTASPALRFPVANARPRDVQSIFGDPRDAGRRNHEGVDIFAKRGTPVVAASSGVVTRVAETGRGGRVVWVWNPARGLSFYYAHLDEQLVSIGDRVNRGDVLGTVGNTGNARTTPPHLHFGIYERGRGAIDPYWFIAPAPVSRTAARN